MKKLFSLFILFLLLTSQKVTAQNDTLGVILISPDYPQCPDTAFGFQPYFNIQVTIENYNGNAAFTGSLYIRFQSDSLPPDSILLNGGSVYTIPPNSNFTVAIQAPYVFNSNNYKLGSNVVVVWPVSTQGAGVIKYNPYYTCVLFVPFLGIDENENELFEISPNPVTDILRFKYPDEFRVKDVRIFDLAGRQMAFSMDSDLRSVTVNTLNSGSYILELTTNSGNKIYRKFIKQ